MLKLKSIFFMLIIVISINAQWKEVKSLWGGNEDGYFGSSVSLSYDGSIMAVGAMEDGYVKVYEYNKSMNHLSQLGSDITGSGKTGYEISLNGAGDIIAIGSPYANGSTSNEGLVRVYKYNGTSWIQMGSNINGVAGDRAGKSVSLNYDGLTLAIGYPDNDGSSINSGLAKVFKYNGTSWIQVGSNMESGDSKGLGTALELDSLGNNLVIGDYLNDYDGYATGAMRVYNFNGTDWSQKGDTIFGLNGGDWFGFDVSISADGNTIVGGAEKSFGDLSNPVSDVGEVRVFKFDGTNWVQKGGTINGQTIHWGLGTTVSISANGNKLVSGGIGYDNNTGYVLIYDYDGSEWIKNDDYFIGGYQSPRFGYSLSLSKDGKAIAAGAPETRDVNESYEEGTASYIIDTTVVISSITKINEFDITYYPNPSIGILNLSIGISQNEDIIVEIVDINGKLILSDKIKANNTELLINVKNITKGQYFLRLRSLKSHSIRKFIVY